MAEQYASFQGKEPNIDVNLFVNALTQGIAAGNAQMSTTGAIFKGITNGINAFIGTKQGMQQIEANAAANEVNTDDDVIDAKKDQIIAEAEKTQAEADSLKDGTTALAKKQAAQTSLAKNKQEYEDITTKDTIRQLIKDGAEGVELANAVTDAFGKGTASRDNDFAQETLAAVKDRIPAETYDALATQANAVENAKQQAALRASDQRSLQTKAAEIKAKYEAASTQLQIYPPIRDVMENGLNGEKYDPTKLSVVKSGNVQRDTQGNIKFDASGMPLVSDRSDDKDKRYIATYNGTELGVMDEDAGKEIIGGMKDYRTGALAVYPRAGQRAPVTNPVQASEITQEGSGLAAQLNTRAATAGQQAIDRYGSPATDPAKALGPDPESLKGKTPAQVQELQEGFERRMKRVEGVSRGQRETFRRVEADPALRNQAPIVKALASVESAGQRGVKSPTGVEDLLQVTGKTFDDIQKRYPSLLPKAAKGTDEGSVLAGRIYLTDLLTQFGDLSQALLAYNAGPGLVKQAVEAVGNDADLETVKESLKAIMYETEAGKKKWDTETSNYVENVLSYYKLYNG